MSGGMIVALIVVGVVCLSFYLIAGMVLWNIQHACQTEKPGKKCLGTD